MAAHLLRAISVSLAAILVAALFVTIGEPVSAAPGPPTLTLTPAPSGGQVAAATITFAVSWAAGWDGSAMSDQLSDTSGHLHFMVDGNPPAMHFAAPAATSTQRDFSFSTGQHAFAVELVNPNHMPYSPAALTAVQFEVTLTEEGIAILSEITALQGDVNTLQGDVGTLQTDVGALQAEVGTLRAAVNTLTALLYAVIVLAVISVVVGAVSAVRAGRARSVGGSRTDEGSTRT